VIRFHGRIPYWMVVLSLTFGAVGGLCSEILLDRQVAKSERSVSFTIRQLAFPSGCYCSLIRARLNREKMVLSNYLRGIMNQIPVESGYVMSDYIQKFWTGKTVAALVVTLGLGILIGVAVARPQTFCRLIPSQKAQTAVAPAQATVAPSQALAAPTTPTIENWNPLNEMRNMQAEMDRMFQRSMERFRMSPQMDIFKGQAGYSSSLDVRDLADRYEVRAYLPDANTSNAKVKLDGNQLTVEVTNHQSQEHKGKDANSNTQSWGNYDQMVQLAGNLKADEMKVKRQTHELLITIPKANS